MPADQGERSGVAGFHCLSHHQARIVGGDALCSMLRRARFRRIYESFLPFFTIAKGLKGTSFVPLGERRIHVCDFRPSCALLFVAGPKEFVRRSGRQARTAEPIRFAHAGRHHQIPADQGKRSGVMEFHAAHLTDSALRATLLKAAGTPVVS